MHPLLDRQREPSPADCIAIVGMRASGKTVLGEALAKALQYDFTDTDAVFTREYGPIASFVAEHGWPHFRKHEESIVEDALQPQAVISLGGAAVESATTRKLLQLHTTVVWIRSQVTTIIERMRNQPVGSIRPSLTDKSLEEEIALKMAERTPHYEGIATIIVEAEQD